MPRCTGAWVLKSRTVDWLTVDRQTHQSEGSPTTTWILHHVESLRVKMQLARQAWAAATHGDDLLHVSQRPPNLNCTTICDQGGLEPGRLRLSRTR